MRRCERATMMFIFGPHLDWTSWPRIKWIIWQELKNFLPVRMLNSSMQLMKSFILWQAAYTMTIRMRMVATKISRCCRRLDRERTEVFYWIVWNIKMLGTMRKIKGIRLRRTETMVEIWKTDIIIGILFQNKNHVSVGIILKLTMTHGGRESFIAPNLKSFETHYSG